MMYSIKIGPSRLLKHLIPWVNVTTNKEHVYIGIVYQDRCEVRCYIYLQTRINQLIVGHARDSFAQLLHTQQVQL